MREYLKIIYFTVLLVGMGPGTGLAQYGGYGGEFLRYGIGGRALALGGAFTGVADDASAAFYNPAGLCQLDRPTISYMSSTLYLDSRYQFGAIILPFYTGRRLIEKITGGVAYVQFGMEGFEMREARTHRRLGDFSDRQSAYIVPLALDWSGDWGRLSVAAEFNAINHELAGYRDHGWGFGLSAFVQPFDLPVGLRFLEDVRLPYIGRPFSLENLMKFRFGLAYRHLPSLILFREAENLPDILRVGMSYTTPLFERRVLLLTSYDYVGGTGLGGRSAIGFELSTSLAPQFVIRARGAYRPGEAWQGRGLVWGVGLESHEFRLGNITGALSLDYVRDKHDVLGAASAFYVSVQIAGGSEDVGSADFFARGRFKLPVLRRALAWHPRDVRRVGWRPDKEAIDERYRDGLGAGLKTGVAEILRRDAELRGNSRAAARYDEFILGFGRLNAEARRTLEQYRSSFGTVQEEVGRLIPQYLERRKKMTKCYNAEAVRLYLDVCVAAGDSASASSVLFDEARQNPCFHRGLRLFYKALMASPGAVDSLRTFGRVGPDTLLYLRFVNALRRGGSEELGDIGQEARGTYRFEGLPMAPLFADGTVSDDAKLLFALRASKDEHVLRGRLISLMIEEPMSDAALIAGTALQGRSRRLTDRVRLIQSWYDSEARPGGVIQYRKFVEFLKAMQEELP